MKTRRLLLAACAVCALLLACVTGQLRGAPAVSGGGPATVLVDTFEALPPASAIDLPLQGSSPTRRHVGDSQFPPSRMVSADVFRPPQG